MEAAAISTSEESIGAPLRRRLAGFSRALRDNGFKIGLAETRDALAILTRPAAARPSTLKPALRSLFCATHSDWERFDEIFEAFWQGRGIHQARTLAGSALESRAPARYLKDVGPRAGTPGVPDHVERRHDDDGGDGAGDGRGRREGASRFENLTSADLRHITDPADIAQAHALAARLSRAMRARLVRRE